MFALTAAALKFGVDVTLQDQPGVYMRMPSEVKDWRGQQLLYCHNGECGWSGVAADTTDGACPQCHDMSANMAIVEKDILPDDTEFLKYIYALPSGVTLNISVVLSGSERNSIHRPQRCLVAQGFDITRSAEASIELPERRPLDLMVLDTLHHSHGPRALSSATPVFYAYWFVGQDRETPSHLKRMFWLAWDRVFHGVAHRWVYIMIQGRGYRSREAFTQALNEFLPRWYPSVLR
jgi:hypothetical protein